MNPVSHPGMLHPKGRTAAVIRCSSAVGEEPFLVSAPSAYHLNVGVYALFRPNVGSVVSTICMNSGRSVTPWESDFSDLRSSLAMPASGSLRDYQLANSLHVRCPDPNRSWTIEYDDGEGTTIDVVWDALMPGFDIQDPEMDPMCAGGTDEGQFAWGTAYDGHFDQTGRVQGTVAIRGRSYDIDCVSTMDHSWGPRPERGKPNMSWLHAHFSPDLAFHAIFGFDERANGTELWLAHGYMLDHGTVYGLKAATGRTERAQERYAESVELELTDRGHLVTGQRREHLAGDPRPFLARRVDPRQGQVVDRDQDRRDDRWIIVQDAAFSSRGRPLGPATPPW